MTNRIWFKREDERKSEQLKVEAEKHIEVCKSFVNELFVALLSLKQEESEEVIHNIEKYIYWE